MLYSGPARSTSARNLYMSEMGMDSRVRLGKRVRKLSWWLRWIVRTKAAESARSVMLSRRASMRSRRLFSSNSFGGGANGSVEVANSLLWWSYAAAYLYASNCKSRDDFRNSIVVISLLVAYWVMSTRGQNRRLSSLPSARTTSSASARGERSGWFVKSRRARRRGCGQWAR
ncbi:hypothetical protein BZA70DRAFT_274305 [Myxozyma melibiosi]|uniref:Uncharacterized protein n=1 Tax=Myxozyma melibiosi TaxID=54550 RepID=A0ABR1FBG9_9ASCO